MKSLAIIFFITALLLTACGMVVGRMPAGSAGRSALTVFAAASLRDAFGEIGKDFEHTHPDVVVVFNFAGSQTLTTQLIQGAVVDIFASASRFEMDKVVSAGLIRPDEPSEFLTNQLVVVLPSNNPGNLQTLRDLADPGLKLVLADGTVPAGEYARQILDNMSRDASYGANFSSRVLANLVSNETDVKQVLAKVLLGEADAGIVYLSDAVAAPDVKTIPIPAVYNVTARYFIASMNMAVKPGLASEFIDFVLSTDGQAILKQWGFTPLKP